ncbi:MAG: Hpt domain-containing protein, partial [Candidatus Omnitrophica bacterium]|nr:Hpt domain-containing protein [Candidatus Omnitrophota bacterium]
QLLAEVIEIFLEDAPGRFKKIKQLMDQNNFYELADAAHTLKGAASNIGAEKLWKSFREMEEMAKQKNLVEVQKIFKRASVEFVELKKYFPKLKTQLAR